MTPQNLAKARIRVGDDSGLPPAERRTRPDPLPLGLSPLDEVRLDTGLVVTVLGHARGIGSVEIGWDDEVTGLPVVSSHQVNRIVVLVTKGR